MALVHLSTGVEIAVFFLACFALIVGVAIAEARRPLTSTEKEERAEDVSDDVWHQLDEARQRWELDARLHDLAQFQTEARHERIFRNERAS